MLWSFAVAISAAAMHGFPPEGPPPAAAQGAAAQVNPQNAKGIDRGR